jgi:hypothetical protein
MLISISPRQKLGVDDAVAMAIEPTAIPAALLVLDIQTVPSSERRVQLLTGAILAASDVPLLCRCCVIPASLTMSA